MPRQRLSDLVQRERAHVVAPPPTSYVELDARSAELLGALARKWRTSPRGALRMVIAATAIAAGVAPRGSK